MRKIVIFTRQHLCRKCDLQEKTALHLTFSLECFNQKRSATLGSFTTLDNIFRKILKFIELRTFREIKPSIVVWEHNKPLWLTCKKDRSLN